MITAATEAIILRTKNIEEYNKLVFLFSRTRGKIKATAYGARKLKNRFGSALEPFTYGRALLIEKKTRGFTTLDQMEIIKSSFSLFEDYYTGAHLYYYADLLDHCLPDDQPEENVFRLILEMLRGFEKGLSPNLVSIYFEVWFLKLLGALPDYTECHHCKASLRKMNTVYISNEGLFFCDKCRLNGIDAGKAIRGEIYHILKTVFTNRIDSSKMKAQKIAGIPITDWTGMLFNKLIEKEVRSYNNLRELRDTQTERR